MTLKKYRSKRDLKATPEPAGGSRRNKKALNFCVQKHDASHLHYDFRLECRGVLLSWAVPKGPSLDPRDKRLAIHVEDHPLDYQYFEGVIPKGHYGAGTVEIWDHGTYTAMYGETIKEVEKYLSDGMKKGHFEIVLSGEKLRGAFVMQKLKKDPDDHAWLLIKKSDAFDSKIKEKPKKHTKLPDFFPPMLATLIDKPFDDEDWLFEIKWDGWRALAFVDRGQVQIKSRTDHVWNHAFPELVKALEGVKGQVILDGEIVVLDDDGRSDFQLLQNYRDTGHGELCYCIFDILLQDGEDLRERPLIERKEILQKYLEQLANPILHYSDHIVEKGTPFFKEAKKCHLEGIVGKKTNSVYQSRRSRDWVKIKAVLGQEVVIGGFTEPRGSRKRFGALLVGVYNDKKELIYSGHVGGGFNTSLLETISKLLKPLVQKKCPFKEQPKGNMEVTWVKPSLICEVKFAEWTREGIMRQPIFLGMREDKETKKVKKEVPVHVTKSEKTKSSSGLSLTHLDKIFWSEEKITKGDLIAYYEAVAPYILPYLKNRPIMLHRYPDGIEGKDFYQKNIEKLNPPAWIKTAAVQHEGKVNHYLMINDLKSLLYAINLGSIDLHPFHSKFNQLDSPDYCLIDIDPHDVPFKHVADVALEYHRILEDAKIDHYLKTSGGKGLHIFIPLHAKYTIEQSRQFAEVISQRVHERFPKYTSLERSPRKRENKIYLDCLQNRSLQGIVAPYAVRPRVHATVSTPLEWDEVDAKLDVSKFTLLTVPKRLEKMGDIFKPVLGPGISMQKALRNLSHD
jgi:bifunctional non-homologous end joining protein LigD